METATKHPVEQILMDHFCDEGLREYLTNIHNNGNSLVCSNGHLLAEISLEQYPELKDVGRNVELFPDYERVIPTETDKTISIDIPVSELITQVNDKDPEEVECSSCNGEGHEDHYCDCEFCNQEYEMCDECEGQGFKEEGERFRSYVKIGAYFFRSSYLNNAASLFQSMEIENCTLKIQPKKDEFSSTPLIAQSEGIRVICMPVFLTETDTNSDHLEITKTIKS